jgi:uncharacterized cupin superfamily protein
MEPNTVFHAATVDLTRQHVPVDPEVEGGTTTGTLAIVDFDGLEVGVWEMTAGVMADVEVEELFIVLSGSATIEFADDSPTLEVNAGDVVRLAAGAETLWTVTETLRKIYLT